MNDIQKGKIPLHVAIIMDGNGRWAKAQNRKRSDGHEEGLATAKRIITQARQMGIQYLSLYAFSTENWKRTSDEVSFLMFLITHHLRKELQYYKDNHIKIIHSGSRNELPQDVLKEIDSIVAETGHFQDITVNLAINYGGRDEIKRACMKLLSSGKKDISEEDISSALDCPSLPDVDLMIRTGGDIRISNFLLWQASYAELYFSEKLWPDFSQDDFNNAINDYTSRERRFGNAK